MDESRPQPAVATAGQAAVGSWVGQLHVKQFTEENIFKEHMPMTMLFRSFICFLYKLVPFLII